MQAAKTTSASAINLVDELYDVTKSGSCHLSILLGNPEFAYSILDTKTNTYLGLYSALSVKEEDIICHAKKLSENEFQSVSCAMADERFTLVPSTLLDEENKKMFFSFNHPIQANEHVHTDILNNVEARNLFTVSDDYQNTFRKYFSNIHFIHSATSFIEGLMIQHKSNPTKKVFADFHFAYFEVVIINGRELLFSNAFKYKTPEDVAYYILFIYEQLQLNPDEIELVLSGEIEKTAEEHSLLYNYIRNVKFATRPTEFQYSNKFEVLPQHKFFSLFTQYLCV